MLVQRFTSNHEAVTREWVAARGTDDELYERRSGVTCLADGRPDTSAFLAITPAQRNRTNYHCQTEIIHMPR